MTTAKKQPWPPPTREVFDKMLHKALTGVDNVDNVKYREFGGEIVVWPIWCAVAEAAPEVRRP